MPWQNLLFVFLAPLLLIALIAALVAGGGSALLAARYAAEHEVELGRLNHTAAELVPVFMALVAATVVFLGATILSRLGPPSPTDEHDHAAPRVH